MTKFRPILKEELDEFAEKCEIIVSHLNQERKAQRDKLVENNFDSKQLRSQIYQNVVEGDH